MDTVRRLLLSMLGILLSVVIGCSQTPNGVNASVDKIESSPIFMESSSSIVITGKFDSLTFDNGIYTIPIIKCDAAILQIRINPNCGWMNIDAYNILTLFDYDNNYIYIMDDNQTLKFYSYKIICIKN